MIKSAQVSIARGRSAALLPTGSDSVAGNSLVIQNTGRVTVFLGDARVSDRGGYALAAAAVLPLELGQEDTLYGFVASDASEDGVVHVLRSR